MSKAPFKRSEALQISLVADECMQALQWRQRTGWPGRGDDIQLSAHLYSESVKRLGQKWRTQYWSGLCEELLARYGAETAAYRAVLCMLATDVRHREQGGRQPPERQR